MGSLKRFFSSHPRPEHNARGPGPDTRLWLSRHLATNVAETDTLGREAGGDWFAPALTLDAVQVEELGPEALVRWFAKPTKR